jgi:hypothetical protein
MQRREEGAMEKERSAASRDFLPSRKVNKWSEPREAHAAAVPSPLGNSMGPTAPLAAPAPCQAASAARGGDDIAWKALWEFCVGSSMKCNSAILLHIVVPSKRCRNPVHV